MSSQGKGIYMYDIVIYVVPVIMAFWFVPIINCIFVFLKVHQLIYQLISLLVSFNEITFLFTCLLITGIQYLQVFNNEDTFLFSCLLITGIQYLQVFDDEDTFLFTCLLITGIQYLQVYNTYRYLTMRIHSFYLPADYRYAIPTGI